MKAIKTWDLFAKVSTDYSPATAVGGVVSVLAVSTMICLFLCEFHLYSTERLTRSILVDQDQGAKLLQVNLNLTLTSLPCTLLTIDHLDILVDYQEGVRGTVTRRRIGKGVDELLTERGETVTTEELGQMLDRGEGCVVEGTFLVAKVPGFLTFAVQHTDLLPANHTALSLAHSLNHLSFGRLHKHAYLSSVFGPGPHTNFSPYDHSTRLSTSHMYFAKIIPITYIDEAMRDTQHSYHYSMTYKPDEESNRPFLTVRYDVETVTVTYRLKAFEWRHFGVHICAVLGGVYVLYGLLLRGLWQVVGSR